MKKLGILTLVFFNYGTRLQSYALCKAIEKIKPSSLPFEVINIEGIWSEKVVNKKKLLINCVSYYKTKSIKKIFYLIKWRIEDWLIKKKDHSEEEAKRIKKFSSLIRKIPYSREKYTCTDIRNGVLNKYSAILVGSDQVWNGIKVPCQDIYMLDYFNGKGLSYAASFGLKTIPQKQFNNYQHRINRFDKLLVREEDGVELCKTLGRNDAECVLDPTLLLSKEEYQTLISHDELIHENFILVYSLNYSYQIYNQADKFAKKNNCRMVILKRSFCPPKASVYPNAIQLYEVSPEEFLWLIHNAKCIITNSYHAMLFSIIFNKNFYLYLDKCDEENSRMLSLSKICHLSNRIVWEFDTLPLTNYDIDYTPVNTIIEYHRQKSMNLLQQAVNSIM